jgi:hypothetical protein
MQLVITWEPEFTAPFFRLRLLNDETGVRPEIDELAVARAIAPDSCTLRKGRFETQFAGAQLCREM